MAIQDGIKHISQTVQDILSHPKKIIDLTTGQKNNPKTIDDFIKKLRDGASQLLNQTTNDERQNKINQFVSSSVNDIANFIEHKMSDPKYHYRTSFVTATSINEMMNDAVSHSGLSNKMDIIFDKEYKELNKKTNRYISERMNAGDNDAYTFLNDAYTFLKVANYYGTTENENGTVALTREIKNLTPPTKDELMASKRFQSEMNNKFLAEGDEFLKLSESAHSIENGIIQAAMKDLKTGMRLSK